MMTGDYAIEQSWWRFPKIGNSFEDLIAPCYFEWRYPSGELNFTRLSRCH